jgi:S1-C subfamily serine protease
MQLYTRRQVLLVSVTTGVCIALVFLGFGFFAGVRAQRDGTADKTHTDPTRTDTTNTRFLGADSAYPAERGRPHPIELDGDLQRYQSDKPLSDWELENTRIYRERNEGVVNITTETLSYNWFLEPVPREGGSGSGSIIDTSGYILTNNHVVRNAVKVYVTLADGTRLEGQVIGSDPENDLAVVSIDPGDRELTVIPMGRSNDLQVGQKVLAIGNPFALDRTLTTGIVSGLGRPLRASNSIVIRDMIQTDASINPGNSGGPLLNTRGEMIGINTMIYSPSGGSIGIGFAVPVHTARRVVPDLIQYGYVNRGWIDIVPRHIIPQLVQIGNLPVSRGIIVSQVEPGGNAEKAGLRGGNRNNAVRYGNTIIYLGGDIILEVDGIPVHTLANLYEVLEDKRPGEEVQVTYLRGRTRRETTVELSQRPERYQWD